MLSLKRLLYIIVMVAFLGGIFLIYTINEEKSASVQVRSAFVEKGEFTDIRPVDDGEKPRVFLLGDTEDALYGEIYGNVLQFCRDIRLTVTEAERLDAESVTERDLVIFCAPSVSRFADPDELKRCIAEGGRVLLAAGLAEGNEDAGLLPVFGIQAKSVREDYSDLTFEKPLLPVQPEQAIYNGHSSSTRIEVSGDAAVYIRETETEVPVLYTYDYQKGSVCLINGTFLADIRCAGLLSGSISALLPDFVYPILGVKAVFLDDFPMVVCVDDAFSMRVYGYSTEGFVQDVVWPAFQGICLRTGTPYTCAIPAVASSDGSFPSVHEKLFSAAGRSALQFDGELVYSADCPENGVVCFNQKLIDYFSRTFTNYTVQGLTMETDNFSPEMRNIPGAEIRAVRGMLESRGTRLSWEEGRTVFPQATEGNSMEDGNLFSICSVLGAYGMVSHAFDIHMLIAGDGNGSSWDINKEQIGLFESEVLSQVSWLKGRTLSQTESDVRSYQDMEYGWSGNKSRLELNCSGAAKGQAFFYHTDGRIVDGEGLTWQDVGNGYYLLRIQENRCVITLSRGE